MARFVRADVDVLVSTMIVESGLDVANANTMIVDRADHFGLAQLYQLRGRVGRSHRRAYCYLLVPDIVDADAEERLRVLEHHTDLGSGYRIALRDLELRGAGNLLGCRPKRSVCSSCPSSARLAPGRDWRRSWSRATRRGSRFGGPRSRDWRASRRRWTQCSSRRKCVARCRFLSDSAAWAARRSARG